MQQIKSIPVNLAHEVLKRSLVKEFYLLIFLKDNCDGWFADHRLDDLFERSHVKVRSTFDAQIKRMVDARWLRRNPITGNYNILSFDWMCKYYKVSHRKRMEYKMQPTLPKFRAWIFAGVLLSRVNSIKNFYTGTEKGRERIALSGGKAFLFQKKKDSPLCRRFGVGFGKVADGLGFTRQYITKMGKAAVRLGFLIMSPIFYKGKQYNNEIKGFVSMRHRGSRQKKRVAQEGRLRNPQISLIDMLSWKAFESGRSSRPSGRRPSKFSYV